MHGFKLLEHVSVLLHKIFGCSNLLPILSGVASIEAQEAVTPLFISCGDMCARSKTKSCMHGKLHSYSVPLFDPVAMER